MLKQEAFTQAIASTRAELKFLIERCTDTATADSMQDLTTKLAGTLSMASGEWDQALKAAMDDLQPLNDSCADAVTADRLQDVFARLSAIRVLSGKRRMMPRRRAELTKLVTTPRAL